MLLTEQSKRAQENLKKRPELSPDWEERWYDARRLPLTPYARWAARQELLRRPREDRHLHPQIVPPRRAVPGVASCLDRRRSRRR